MYATTLFIIGLFIGSFANVLIYRIPLGKPWVAGRSYCPKCKHKLYWYDLIPLFSWIFLHRKCRYCHKPISFRYPLIELTNAGLWGIIGLTASTPYGHLGLWNLGYQNNISLITTLLFLILSTCLLVIFVIDIQHFIIPDNLTITIAIISLILILIQPNYNSQQLITNLLWGLGAFSFFFLLHFITRGKGMGWGDVKFSFVMGLLLEKNVLVALMIAFVSGAIIGILLLATKIAKPQQPIPFGPFLVFGTIIGLIYGSQLLNWYLPFLGY